VIATALFSRLGSRGEAEYSDKLLSALRMEFGGHAERPATE
jgi:6-phosphogluconate dehydrogenase